MNQLMSILIVDSEYADRTIIRSAIQHVVPRALVKEACNLAEAVAELNDPRRPAPNLLLWDWFLEGADSRRVMTWIGEQPHLSEMQVVIMARLRPRDALIQAQECEARRFVSKLPDNESFRTKISDAIAEHVRRPYGQ